MAADALNYHHLLYFWTVVREGSVVAACERLHLAQPTISGQLRKLERQLGGRLYDRVGRDLVLTDLGRTVYKYAEEIFTIGEELVEAVQGRAGRPLRLQIGVPEVMPKLIVFRLLRSFSRLDDPPRLVCREGPQEHLLTQLAAHQLDVVLSDSPAGTLLRVRVFNHALGECGVGLYGTRRLLDQFGADFPQSFAGAPLLLPGVGTSLRRATEEWLAESQLDVRIIGEFDDTALMKVFAEADVGFVPAPLAIEEDILKQFSLHRLCVLPRAKERFYAITVERKLRHPAVLAIAESARRELFDPS